jgi:DeoR family transcriptional regulator, suf operon transcriptional repressor
MSTDVSSTRAKLLGLLLRYKTGLTIDELGEKLAISRNAVRQHVSSLENGGLVAVGEMRRGVGRPSQIYTLTPLGSEQFPRQYSLLSELVLASVKELHGPAGTAALMKEIADRLARQYSPRIQGETVPERADTVAAILNEIGFLAETEQSAQGTAITALNCVYHHLATEFPEVCQLDIELIQQLTGARVEHSECMVRGGLCCRFQLTERR